MKLEAGKKYIRRDGVIVECLRVWDEPKTNVGYQATVWSPEMQYGIAYSLDGALLPHLQDIVAEVTEVPDNG